LSGQNKFCLHILRENSLMWKIWMELDSIFILPISRWMTHWHMNHVSIWFTWRMKNDGFGGRVYSLNRCNFLWALSLFTLHVSSLSPSMPSLKTALVRQGFIKNDTSVCRLICVASWRPCSTTNEGEVWAQQRSKKSAGLRPSVLTIKHN